MTKEQIKISRELLTIAQEQYKNDIISRVEYLEVLLLIKNRIKTIKNGFDSKEFLQNNLKKPHLEINLKDTVNFVLAMN